MPLLAEGASVDVSFTGDSTLTIEAPGGFYEVQYPIGTVVFRGGGAVRNFDFNGGSARITATTRGLTYYATPDSYGARVATLTTAQVAAGATAALAIDAASDAISGPSGIPALSALSLTRERVLAAPGTTVLDFGAGSSIATTTATQSSCVAVWNPTGWPDGTGCLEITPNTDSFSEFRMYFDATKQFDLWSDDGYAVEWIMPNIEDKPANPGLAFTIGRGATSTGAPADTRTVGLYKQATGTTYFSGRRYDRHRWDFDTTDAKCGVWPGYAATATGAGVNKTHTINWLRFEFSKIGGKTVKIKRVVRGGRARPCLVLGTDSAAFYPLSELVNAYAAQYGLKWSVNQYFGGGTGVDDIARSRDVIRAIYASGSDYNVNDLIDRPLATAGLNQQQITDMVAQCRAKAEAYGWRRGSNIHIYNNNSYNDTVVAGMAAGGIVAARGGNNDGRFVFTEGGVVNPLRLPAASWDQLTTAQMTAQIDRVIEVGATQWAYWHNVYSTARVTDDGQTAVGASTPSAYAAANAAYCTPRGINGLTVWWEELKGALDYIVAKRNAGLIDVMTPSQWCAAHGIPAIQA